MGSSAFAESWEPADFFEFPTTTAITRLISGEIFFAFCLRYSLPGVDAQQRRAALPRSCNRAAYHRIPASTWSRRPASTGRGWHSSPSSESSVSTASSSAIASWLEDDRFPFDQESHRDEGVDGGISVGVSTPCRNPTEIRGDRWLSEDQLRFEVHLSSSNVDGSHTEEPSTLEEDFLSLAEISTRIVGLVEFNSQKM